MMIENNKDLDLTHSNVNGSFIVGIGSPGKAKRKNADASRRIGILALMSSEEVFLSFKERVEVLKYGATRGIGPNYIKRLKKKENIFGKCVTMARVRGSTTKRKGVS